MNLGYLWAQWRHTWGKRGKDPTFRIRPAVRALGHVGQLGRGAHVLSLGCRNRIEPDLLEEAGWLVTAVDLFPMARRIKRADMHALPFPSGTFDAVVASHVLEHAEDPDRALAEVARVLRTDGLLWAAWPRGFTPTAHDRVDYGSAFNFLERFPRRAEILWRDNEATQSRVLLRMQ